MALKPLIAGLSQSGGGGTAVLPPQTGHAGEFLTTDGTNPDWVPLSGGGDVVASGALANNAVALGGGGTTLQTTTTGTGIVTALGVNVGSAGAPVINGGALGTPSSGTATNLTGTAAGLTAGVASAVAVGGITGLGTGVATALAINVGSAGAPVVLNGAGGTPSSLTGTNITGTAAGLTAGVASAVAVGGVTGLGTGVGTFLATPSSANLAATVTGETGSGALVFATSPTLVTPTLGVVANGSIEACTVNGSKVGYLGIPPNSQSADYTTVLSDEGKCILHPASDTNDRIFTIAAESSVDYPLGTVMEFMNLSINDVDIAITDDVLRFLPSGATGTRSLAQWGRASAEKVASGVWVISGNSALT